MTETETYAQRLLEMVSASPAPAEARSIENPTFPVSPEQLDALVGYGPTRAGVQINEWTALTYTAVFCAVRVLSESIGMLPLAVFAGDDDEDVRVRAKDHAAYNLLRWQPNDEMTASVAKEAIQANLTLWGNGYARILHNAAGDPAAVIPLQSDRTWPERYAGQLRYTVRDELERFSGKFAPEEIIHVPGLSLNGLRGLTPIGYCREAVALGKATEIYGATFFGNGATVAGTLEFPGPMTPEQRAQLRESINSMHSGPGNAHKFMILTHGGKFSPRGIPPEDAQFLECVVASTLVTMADGSRRRADQVAAGDMVLGWSYERACLVPSRVSHVDVKPATPLLTVTTHRGRTLTTTPNHPYLASRRQRCAKCGRYHGSKNAHQGLDPAWIAAEELNVGDYVRIALDHAPEAGTSVSANEAWFVGAMVGDGSIRRSLAMAFSNADPAVIDRARRFAGALGGQMKHRANYDYEFVGMGYGDKNALRNLFARHCLLGTDCYTKRLPDLIVQGGKRAWSAFLAGYFDTDGSINRACSVQPRAYWASANRPLLEDCQHLLALLGIQASIYESTCVKFGAIRTGYQLVVCGRSQIAKLARTLDLTHSRKRQRLDDWRATMPVAREHEDFVAYDRIVKIEETPAQNTIVMEIEDTHSHVTNGIVTHNTRKFQVSEIARIYRIPAHMLGDLERATHSNIEQASLEFLVYTLMPWLEKWEQELTRKLCGVGSGYHVKFDDRRLLRTDTAARQQYYQIGRQWGFLDADDVRAMEGMPPLPDGRGQIYLSPVNMVPAENAKNIAAPKPGTPTAAGEGDGADAHPASSGPTPRTSLDPETITTTLVPVWEDAIDRMRRKETNARSRGKADEDFYRQHAQHVREALMPAARSLLAMLGEGWDREAVTRQIDEIIDEFATRRLA